MTYTNFPTWPGWKTIGIIGRGSFGTVYEIQRDVFGKIERAALKEISIPQEYADIEEMRSEGYSEQDISTMLQENMQSVVSEYSMMREMGGNSNIVSCDDLNYTQHDDGLGWDILIKMELLTPLAKLPSDSLCEDDIIKIGIDLTKALELCRKHNIIHRDIKPQNIFLSSNGDYKLGDFGVAKTIEKTTSGSKSGTPDYMAPEVYNYRPYGTGADIYSLGLVMYWLINDRRLPFLPPAPKVPTNNEKESARGRRLSGEEIPIPASGSEELCRIILKACAYHPEDRFRTPAEMTEELLKVQSNSKASNAGRSQRSGRPSGDETVSAFNTRKSTNIRTPDGEGTVSALKREPEREHGGSKVSSDEDAVVRDTRENKTVSEGRIAATKSDTRGYDPASGGYSSGAAAPKSKKPKGFFMSTGAIIAVAVVIVALAGFFALKPLLFGNSGNTAAEVNTTTNTDYANTNTVPDYSGYDAVEETPEPEPVAVYEEPAAQEKTTTESSQEKTYYVEEETIETVETAASQFQNVSVGDIITFGSYEQDNNTSNGKEDIEWIVLAKENSKILVISKYGLDSRPYNDTWKQVTWDTCTLRTWMNSTFISNAFSSEEQEVIETTHITTDDNPESGTSAGNDTNDKVFLLSISEADRYFSSGLDRMCAPTEYAIARGALTTDEYSMYGRDTGHWQLRTPGADYYYATGVNYAGSIFYFGLGVTT